MGRVLVRVWGDEGGQDLIEYALLAAFVALASVAAMVTLGGGINGLFGAVNAKLASAAAGS
jgi:Flp pilus assembly pilin Flp